MGKNSSDAEAKIEAEFESLLRKCGNEKLLTVDSGVSINMLLLVHPSPRPLIKTVIQRRRIEDLVLLLLTMPAAANNVLRARPNMKEADSAHKFTEVYKMLSEESVAFDKFIDEMSSTQNREAVVELQNAANALMIAYSEAGFDADRYFSQHPNVLSIMMDWYLVYQFLSASSSPNYPKEEFETAMNLIWKIRDLLANYRIKAR
jgi:hypothetical protein